MSETPRLPRRDLPQRVLAACVMALVLTGLVAPAALAVDAEQDTGVDAASLDHAQPSESGVELLVSLPPGAGSDLDGIQVSIAGEEVEATAALAAEEASVRRTAVLAIDTSVSMRGERIAAAESAARAYLDTVPADVEVGVVTFDNDVKVVLEPTRDRDAAREAVTDLDLTLQTALYEGVLGAVAAAGASGDDAGQRSVLVLSDGRDSTGSPLSAALRGVEESGVLLDVVALQQRGPGALPLQLLAEAGRGEVLDAADPAALEATFAKEALALARQVVVTAAVPDSVDASADVTVTVPQADATAAPVVVTAYLDVRGQAAEQAAAEAAAEERRETQAAARAEVEAPGPRFDFSDVIVWGGISAIGLGLLGVVLVLSMSKPGPDREQKLRTQLQAYGVFGGTQASGAAAAGSTSSLSDTARGVAEKALSDRAGLEAAITARLEAAGMHLKAAEWLLLHGGIVIGATTMGLLLGRGNLILAVLGLVAGSFGPWLYLGLKKGKRLKAFASNLAETLQLMSGSLSAGLSLAQSIDTIVREGVEPISGEFRQIVVETRLGVSLEDAMDGVAGRMDSKDFAWVVMAIKIQREVGGNLAELLLQVAATLREREFLQRHVRALSAEGRLSAWVLGGLPPGFLLYLSVSKPDYVSVLYTDPRGWIMLAGMAVLLGVGVLWMSKVAKVEV